MRNVVLGARSMLHNGIHGALTDAPPPDVTYSVRGATHTVALPPSARTPYDALPLAEFVDFGPGEEMVHSAYWPVLNRRRWVVECGDYAYALFCGQYAFTRDFLDQAREPIRPSAFDAAVVARATRMLAAYAHDSCKAVIVYTEHEGRNLRQWIDTFAPSDVRSTLLAKVRLCRPAVAPVRASALADKWTQPSLRVVFCGRWFESKNGLLALNVFDRCLRDGALEFTFIGPIPESVRALFPRLLNRIEHCPRLTRAEVCAKLTEAHIYFHPSPYESVGMALLEAAACGTAIVARQGSGMEHLSEWFGESGAILVDDAGEGREFHEALTRLGGDRILAEEYGRRNHRAATLAIASRDDVLGGIYDAAPAAEPLRTSDIIGDEDHWLHRSRCDESMRRRADHAAVLGKLGERLHIPIDLARLESAVHGA